MNAWKHKLSAEAWEMCIGCSMFGVMAKKES